MDISRIAKPLVLSIGALGLAWGAASHTIGLIARNKNPELALKVVHDEPIALAILADKKLTEAKSAADTKESGELALESLRGQALNPRALRVIGFVKDANGQSEQSAVLIKASALLSRRNLGTQLWLIEEAIKKNDTKEALRQYHLALTTSPNAKDILFPVLTKAIANQEIAKELVPYVKSNEEWIVPFIQLASQDKDAIIPIADIVIEAGGIKAGLKSDQVRGALMERLSQQGDLLRAAKIFQTIDNAPVNILSSPALTTASFDQAYVGVGWALMVDPSLGGEVSGAGDTKIMTVYASGGKSGRVARKPLLLKPGQYVLRVGYSDLVSNPNSIIRWQISCAGEGKATSIASGASPTGANVSKATLAFTISPSCNGQFLDLLMTGGDGRNASEVTINSVEIIKAS